MSFYHSHSWSLLTTPQVVKITFTIKVIGDDAGECLCVCVCVYMWVWTSILINNVDTDMYDCTLGVRTSHLPTLQLITRGSLKLNRPLKMVWLGSPNDSNDLFIPLVGYFTILILDSKVTSDGDSSRNHKHTHTHTLLLITRLILGLALGNWFP